MWARSPDSLPLLQRWRIDVIVPAAPIVPSNKDHRVSPQLALSQRADAIGGPLAAQLHCRLTGVSRERGMFGELHGLPWRIDPGDTRQFSRRDVRIEIRPRLNIGAAFQLVDLRKVTKAWVAVGRPAQIPS